MDINLLNAILGEQGISGVIVICFILMVFWNIKKTDKMQEKLFEMGDTINHEIPRVYEKLDDISNYSGRCLESINEIKDKLNR